MPGTAFQQRKLPVSDAEVLAALRPRGKETQAALALRLGVSRRSIRDAAARALTAEEARATEARILRKHGFRLPPPTPTRMYVCEADVDCEAEFPSAGALARHLELHHGTKPAASPRRYAPGSEAEWLEARDRSKPTKEELAEQDALDRTQQIARVQETLGDGWDVVYDEATKSIVPRRIDAEPARGAYYKLGAVPVR